MQYHGHDKVSIFESVFSASLYFFVNGFVIDLSQRKNLNIELRKSMLEE